MSALVEGQRAAGDEALASLGALNDDNNFPSTPSDDDAPLSPSPSDEGHEAPPSLTEAGPPAASTSRLEPAASPAPSDALPVVPDGAAPSPLRCPAHSPEMVPPPPPAGKMAALPGGAGGTPSNSRRAC